MPESLGFVKGLASWMRRQRTRLLVLFLVMALVMPQPTKGQFLPIDLAAIVSAIGAINTAITNVIGAGLRDISGALNAVNGVLNAIQSFFQSTVYPLDAINRARAVVGAVQGFYNAIRGLVNLNVASATLANPQQRSSSIRLWPKDSRVARR
ncbi:MAG: hypothetical protein ACRD7E_06900 [Bryobacteraceae bacterium]